MFELTKLTKNITHFTTIPRLNRKLFPGRFSLPRIEDIFDNLGRSKYFSIMDLQSGFHQIPLAQKFVNTQPSAQRVECISGRCCRSDFPLHQAVLTE